jgi:UDP-glucose 4-epimerase
MNILVTGGAGYVGSIVCEELIRQQHTPVVLDNLQQGHRSAVLPEAEFILGDISDSGILDIVFSRRHIDIVIHLAALNLVSDSMSDPAAYFRNNVAAGLNLLDAMLAHDVKQIVFSSSAAVYGEPVHTPIEETDPRLPVNSYGETKLMFEKILAWYGRAYGLKHISFRYFNAAGASQRLGEDHRPETHLIPAILLTALNGTTVKVFGTDYPTRDGSCIRDYVHVRDIARAHVLALGKLDALTGRAYNLGNGDGYSVLEVIAAAERVCGKKLAVDISGRRPGDPAVLLASAAKAKKELGWQPRYSGIEEIINSAWKWMQTHPHGYEE